MNCYRFRNGHIPEEKDVSHPIELISTQMRARDYARYARVRYCGLVDVLEEIHDAD